MFFNTLLIKTTPRKQRLSSYLIWKCLVSVQDEFSLLEDIICSRKLTKYNIFN